MFVVPQKAPSDRKYYFTTVQHGNLSFSWTRSDTCVRARQILQANKKGKRYTRSGLVVDDLTTRDYFRNRMEFLFRNINFFPATISKLDGKPVCVVHILPSTRRKHAPSPTPSTFCLQRGCFPSNSTDGALRQKTVDRFPYITSPYNSNYTHIHCRVGEFDGPDRTLVFVTRPATRLNRSKK